MRGGASARWCWSTGASTEPCVCIVDMSGDFQRFIVLPESAHTDGDDGEEVAETSDDNYKHNVHDLQNLQPRKHCLHL